MSDIDRLRASADVDREMVFKMTAALYDERALTDDLADALRRFKLEVELLLARYREARGR